MTNRNHWATPTHELADVEGSVGDLTAKLWDELAADGDEAVAVEWIDGSPMPFAHGAETAYYYDVFSRDYPAVDCCSEFTRLQESGELLATL